MQTNRKPEKLAPLTLFLVTLTLAGAGALHGQPDHHAAATGRWDPSFGADALNGPVYALEVYAGELYAGGDFTDAAGTAVSSVARWDGSQWRDVGGGVRFEDDPGTVLDLAVYDDGSGPRLFAVGEFDTAGAVSVKHAARWDGTAWTNASAGYPIGITEVSDLGVVGGTEAPGLYSGGVVPSFGCGVVMRWVDASSSWVIVLVPNAETTGIDSVDDGSGETAFIGGPYFGCSGTPIWGGSLKWDGGWQALNSIFQPERFLEYQGEVYGCGNTVYDAHDDDWFGPIETWDGMTWEEIPTYVYGIPANCYDLEVFDDCAADHLFVGGAGLTPAGLGVNGIFKLRGTTWRPLGSGIPSGSVRALETFQDDLYVAGQFTVAGGNAVENVARWIPCN